MRPLFRIANEKLPSAGATSGATTAILRSTTFVASIAYSLRELREYTMRLPRPLLTGATVSPTEKVRVKGTFVY